MSAKRESPPTNLEQIIAGALAGNAAAEIARAIFSSDWWIRERESMRRQALAGYADKLTADREQLKVTVSEKDNWARGRLYAMDCIARDLRVLAEAQA